MNPILRTSLSQALRLAHHSKDLLDRQYSQTEQLSDNSRMQDNLVDYWLNRCLLLRLPAIVFLYTHDVSLDEMLSSINRVNGAPAM